MAFDREQAITILAGYFAKEYGAWECGGMVREIASTCGLGDLTKAAENHAIKQIRSWYGPGGGVNDADSPRQYARLDRSRAFFEILAGKVEDAVKRFPRPGATRRPVPPPPPAPPPPPSSAPRQKAKPARSRRRRQAAPRAGQSGIDAFPEAPFAALRQMDREATNITFEHGHPFPTGLRYYDKHVHPNPVNIAKPHYEPERAWPERLKALLTDPTRGTSAVSQKRYPRNAQTCDLVVTFANGETLWIEMKGSWPYYRNSPTQLKSWSTHRKHLTSPTEGVAKDFLKVGALTRADATYVAVLVIAFDIADVMPVRAETLEEMKRNASFDPALWSEHYVEWKDEHQEQDARHGGRTGFRVRCWLWHRAVAST